MEIEDKLEELNHEELVYYVSEEIRHRTGLRRKEARSITDPILEALQQEVDNTNTV